MDVKARRRDHHRRQACTPLLVTMIDPRSALSILHQQLCSRKRGFWQLFSHLHDSDLQRATELDTIWMMMYVHRLIIMIQNYSRERKKVLHHFSFWLKGRHPCPSFPLSLFFCLLDSERCHRVLLYHSTFSSLFLVNNSGWRMEIPSFTFRSPCVPNGRRFLFG